MRVLDACAAPGGKSTHLLELENIELTILDNSIHRLQKVRENLTRLKLSAHQIIDGDARYPAQWWDGRLFDRIMVDAPCSASGVVRRHPDIKWRRKPEDISHYAQTQLTILEGMWPLLKHGARLLYITCSIFQEENILLVKNFYCITRKQNCCLRLTHNSTVGSYCLTTIMMVSFMPLYKNIKPTVLTEKSFKQLAMLCLLTLITLPLFASPGGSIHIKSFDFRKSTESFRMDVLADISLNQTLEDALKKELNWFLW